ncbi:MAG TPA: DUF1326 domain-containing protein [Gammaproteobacteria bacterium]|nr:DUF1326 domain-containing protein [Gammaproteobacteria bacterium]
MAYADWEIRGPVAVTCNCDWGCPCQFNSRPTHGDCTAAIGMQVHSGHFDAVALDGLRWVALLAWPGAIHEGHGQCLPIVDERADEAQREALLTILSGLETEPGATVFNVFAATYDTVHQPRFAAIDFEADPQACTARIRVPGLVEATGRPIANPVTGEPHRVRVGLPRGFEYREAEYGSSTASASDPMPMAWTDRHAHMFEMHMTPYGPAG